MASDAPELFPWTHNFYAAMTSDVVVAGGGGGPPIPPVDVHKCEMHRMARGGMEVCHNNNHFYSMTT